MSCLPRNFAKRLLVTNGSLFDFKYYVILIYRLKVSDRAGFIQVIFGFHLKCGGSSGFSLLKKC